MADWHQQETVQHALPVSDEGTPHPRHPSAAPSPRNTDTPRPRFIPSVASHGERRSHSSYSSGSRCFFIQLLSTVFMPKGHRMRPTSRFAPPFRPSICSDARLHRKSKDLRDPEGPKRCLKTPLLQLSFLESFEIEVRASEHPGSSESDFHALLITVSTCVQHTCVFLRHHVEP